ncbi:HAMP domain-containing methyl-accepting chemotaxis protein [Desulfobacter vibrioformis]|uniref:HAMP domain-containing methyl-accepting chemotaxis protein n=1 Tax=Desulfobacter vibrioformis TaxID=34031 RepID=UPI000690FF23|nr:methyl-accepting chemotaxis protein [Desulfobacter vibrioformis]
MDLKNVTLKTKLVAGFSVVIIMMLIVAGAGFIALKQAASGFGEYREMARDTNLAGRLQANMLEVQMNVENYLISGSDEALKNYNARWALMSKFQAQAQEDIKDPKRAEKVDEIETLLKDYKKGFEAVTAHKARRNHLVNDVLNVNGPIMEKSLTQIMISANGDGDVTAAYNAGMTMRNLLLARLYMAKFLDTNDQAAVDRVHGEFAEMKKALDVLDRELDNPGRREKLALVQDAEKIYLKAFDDLVVTIFKRNDVIENTLGRIGSEVADKVEALKLDIKKVQDEIGPRLQSFNQKSVTVISIVSVLALISGILIVTFVTKGVMAQLGSDPLEILKIAESIAAGNLVFKFDENSSKNRGVYGSMKNMSENLSKMIKDIANGVVVLDSSSGDLSAVSEQMASNVEQTAEKSNNVAAASEEMATSMNSVAAATEQATANIQTIVTAVEEMSATISEIARNTAKGGETTARAVDTAEQVSGKVDDLGRAAAEISKVTETIADISEQTNLLALNATIEAARAGEAGKGFAVVAAEIKALALQTAEATSGISSRISGIQSTTRESVEAISSIVAIINEINEIVTSVSAAIEEQSATTQEIASNVSQAAAGINEVNENVNQVSAVVGEVNMDINLVNQATDDVRSGGLQVKSSANKLSELAGELSNMVGRFTV